MKEEREAIELQEREAAEKAKQIEDKIKSFIVHTEISELKDEK